MQLSSIFFSTGLGLLLSPSTVFSLRRVVALLKRVWLARLAVLAIAFVAYPLSAKASPSVLAVRTKGPAQEKVAVQVVTEAVTRAGWTITPRAFSPQELEELAKCFPAAQPWPCLAKATRDATIRRLVLLSLEAQTTTDGTPMTVVTVQVASEEQRDAAHGGRRYCQPCSPELLAKLTAEVSREALEWMRMKSAKTFLEVKSRPLGATVSVDGKRLGVTDTAFPITPGTHQVIVSHPKYPAETRVVEVKENRTAVVTIVFGPNNASGGLVDPARAAEFREGAPSRREEKTSPSVPRAKRANVAGRSLLLPTALISAGAVVITGGAVALLLDKDDADSPPNTQEPQKETFRNTAPLGVGMLIGGALVAGAGGWLLWRDGAATPKNQLFAVVLPDGSASFSLVRAF